MELRVINKLREEMGPHLVDLIDVPQIEDIMVNPDGQVWTNQGRYPLVLSPDRVRSVINTVAFMHDSVVTADHPSIEAVLPFSSARFKGLVPPETTAPIFIIRTRPKAVLKLDDYVNGGAMTEHQVENIIGALLSDQNILIVGSPGSGKTTLLNACLRHLALNEPDRRVVSIEDTPEIDTQVIPNFVSLLATEDRSMTVLLRDALRSAANRLVVGEVRGPEALDLLMAWNTGHGGGIATIHAKSAYLGLVRLESLIRLATDAPQEHLIAEAVNIIVFIQRDATVACGRKVTEMKRVAGFVTGFNNVHGGYALEDL